MTKEALIEFIRLNLPGGIKADRLRYHEEVISMAISLAFNQAVSLSKRYGYTFDNFRKRYTINVTRDAGRTFCSLPVSIIPVSGKSKGVFVSLSSSQDTIDFIPVTDGEIAIFKNTRAAAVDGTFSFIVRSDEIELFGVQDDLSSVLVYLPVSFDSYDMEDEISIPSGAEMNLMGAVIGILTQTNPIEKQGTDENPNTP